MFNLVMIVNNSQNPYAINEIYASKPLRNESSSLSANTMPTNDRMVSETSVTKRPLNNTPPNFIRHVYVNLGRQPMLRATTAIL